MILRDWIRVLGEGGIAREALVAEVVAAVRAAFGEEARVAVDEAGVLEVRRGDRVVGIDDPSDRVRVARAVSAVLFGHRPAAAWRPGGSGALLQAGGGWLVGLTGREGDVSVRIVEGWLEALATHAPSATEIRYGLAFAIERGGRVEVHRQENVDNDEGTRAWFDGPVTEASVEAVQRVLQQIAAALGDTPLDRIGGLPDWVDGVLIAAQPAIPEGSLAAWCRDVLLPAAVGGISVGDVRADLLDPILVDKGKYTRGSGFITVRIVGPRRAFEVGGDDEIDLFETSLSLGRMTQAAYDAPAPDPDTEAALLALPDRVRAHLGAELSNRAEHGLPHGAWWAPSPPMLQLLALAEARAQLGDPGPPPVPEPDDAAIAALAARLAAPTPADIQRVADVLGQAPACAVWIFRLGRWLVVLRDDPKRPPHGAAHMSLLADDDGFVTVQSTDVWSPSTRSTLDGDAFAYRRFREHLRRALIARPDLDRAHPFTDDVTYEEEALDEDYTGTDEDGTRVHELTASAWLLYDRADLGDRFLVDWRAQRDVVTTSLDVAATAATYAAGRAPAPAADQVRWRAFLAEEIHAGFARS